MTKLSKTLEEKAKRAIAEYSGSKEDLNLPLPGYDGFRLSAEPVRGAISIPFEVSERIYYVTFAG